MSHLINIFLEPVKVFADLRDKPSFLLPALLVVLASAAVISLYFFRVDPEWLLDAQLAAAGGDMSAAELDQARQMMPGARTMGIFTTPMILLSTSIIYALYALYYWLASKVTGHAASYRHGLALTAWSAMPMLLGVLVLLVGILISSPQSSLESMQLLNIDPLIVQLPADHAWSSLAKAFSLLNFWVWFLVALGWKTWFRTGWGQAIVVALLPNIVIYGIWAAISAL